MKYTYTISAIIALLMFSSTSNAMNVKQYKDVCKNALELSKLPSQDALFSYDKTIMAQKTVECTNYTTGVIHGIVTYTTAKEGKQGICTAKKRYIDIIRTVLDYISNNERVEESHPVAVPILISMHESYPCK